LTYRENIDRRIAIKGSFFKLFRRAAQF